MKIVHVARFGGAEELQLIERETPVAGPGQILVDVKASGINFADVMARGGHYPGIKSAPFDPGFEVAGVVSGVGDGVSGFQIGDRAIGLVASGGYATHAILEAATALPLPENLDFAPATALLIQGLTAYFLLETAGLKVGETVLIPSAAGGVGSLAVQIAKLKGAGTVIGLASPTKHERVTALGTDAVFDYTQPGWSKAVREATQGHGIDIYLDSQGDLEGEGTQTFADQARWMIYGGQAEGAGVLTAQKMWELVFQNVTLRGYTVYSNMGEMKRAWDEMIGWVLAGQLKIHAEDRFSLSDADKAHTAIEARQTTGKVVLEP